MSALDSSPVKNLSILENASENINFKFQRDQPCFPVTSLYIVFHLLYFLHKYSFSFQHGNVRESTIVFVIGS